MTSRINTKLGKEFNFLEYSLIDIFCLYFSFKLYKNFIKIKPNIITILSGLSGLLGIIIISLYPSRMIFLLGSLLLIIFLILDCIDGEVARQTNQKSSLGAWLDPFFDKLIESSLLLASGYFAFKYGFSLKIYFMVSCSIIFFQFNQFLLIMDQLNRKNFSSSNSLKKKKSIKGIFLNLFLKNFSLGHSALVVSFMILINLGLIEHLAQIYFFWSLFTLIAPVGSKFSTLLKEL